MRRRRWVERASCGAVLALLVGGGCARGKGDDRPKPYRLCLQTSPRLNWYDGREHALYVRIFHLSSRDAFERADLASLRARDAELPGQTAPTTDRNVLPGGTIDMEVLVEPRTVFLGIVGHYFEPGGESKRLVPVADLDDEEDGCEDIDTDEVNWVRFGPGGIEAVKDAE